MKTLMLICLLITSSSLMAMAKNLPLETVHHVDLERYVGTWYEIARFENSFQKNCTATQADYSLRQDGDIKVINSCRLNSPNGKIKSAQGRAWVKDKNTNAKLKVQFLLNEIKLPFISGDYWILELDANYQHVLIGDPTRKYLWILSRSINMDENTYNFLVNKARDLQFDVNKLVKTIH